MQNLSTKKLALAVAATVGFLFILPLPFMAYINRYHSEPFYSFLSSFPGIELDFSPLFLLSWFPIVAIIAALLMLRRDATGKRKMLGASIVVIILVAIFLVVFTMLGQQDFFPG